MAGGERRLISYKAYDRSSHPVFPYLHQYYCSNHTTTEAFTMERHGCTNLTEVVRSVQLLKIDGYLATTTMCPPEYIKFRWHVDGHEWEVHFYPNFQRSLDSWVTLYFNLLKAPTNKLRVKLSGRLVDPSRNLQPSVKKSVSHVFRPCALISAQVLLMRAADLLSSGYIVNDSLTVESTITVVKELSDITIPDKKGVPLPMPVCDLHKHFGELLQNQTGADITFAVSGESFAAHKSILAARSPVFRAEFFGNMNERSSQRVQIQDMEATVFKTMLHFIYTDTAPELEGPPDVATTMAQHLLAAADRYGLDRLKLICEGKLLDGIDVDTAASTLALAEQHNCPHLRAKCVEFITETSERLQAVLATEGYQHLVASCPSVLTELLMAARGRRN
ncbi:hypothetical protein ACP70R_043509 [Stipagrostis hirtigluma subsp. patula]